MSERDVEPRKSTNYKSVALHPGRFPLFSFLFRSTDQRPSRALRSFSRLRCMHFSGEARNHLEKKKEHSGAPRCFAKWEHAISCPTVHWRKNKNSFSKSAWRPPRNRRLPAAFCWGRRGTEAAAAASEWAQGHNVGELLSSLRCPKWHMHASCPRKRRSLFRASMALFASDRFLTPMSERWTTFVILT